MLIDLRYYGLACCLVLLLTGCAESEQTSVDWGGADYAQIICASPGAGCKNTAENEKEEEERGHHGHRSKR